MDTDEAVAKLAEVVRDARSGKRIEANGVLRRQGDEWGFSIDFDNGVSIGVKGTYPTQEEAHEALNEWCAEVGITEIMRAN